MRSDRPLGLPLPRGQAANSLNHLQNFSGPETGRFFFLRAVATCAEKNALGCDSCHTMPRRVHLV